MQQVVVSLLNCTTGGYPPTVVNQPSIQECEWAVSQGLLTSDVYDNLVLYNYSLSCEKRRLWTPTTIAARGIVFNWNTGECVARPMQKIFSCMDLVDPDQIPWDKASSIEEKIDGHLGILFRHGDELRITTRGSFLSPSSLLGTAMLQKHALEDLDDALTLCFEIVHPTTHVIVEYGKAFSLVLLAAIHRHTGEELSRDRLEQMGNRYGFPLAKRYTPATPETLAHLLVEAQADPLRQEGFVVRFETGLRMKYKTQSYLALMREQMRYGKNQWSDRE